ncbi:hypothetical protein D3C84_1270700 [compost metagenome]
MKMDVFKLTDRSDSLLPEHIGNLAAYHSWSTRQLGQILYDGKRHFSGNTAFARRLRN